MNVTFIGAGNLAWHLAPALENSGYAVREVFSRNAASTATLVEKLYAAQQRVSLDFSASNSRIFIMAVPDDVIGPVSREIVLPEKAVLLHTSGSQPLEVLDYAAIPSTGVFYPLQTFSKARKIDFRDVPIFVESNDPETLRIITNMGKALSKSVHAVTSENRRAIHLAAVFASNFVNHMLTLSEELLVQHELPFEHLRPLITETVNKALSLGPERSQTGPARRGDLEILDKHLEILQDDEVTKEIYRIISQDILDRYTKTED